MSAISYVTQGSYRNRQIILQETFRPEAFARVATEHGGRAQELQDNLNLAGEFSDIGNIDIQLRGRDHGACYQMDILFDASNNASLCRASNWSAICNRLGAALGVKPGNDVLNIDGARPVPFPAPSFDSEAIRQDSLPEPCFVGDLLRAIGHALGLLADYLVLGIYIGCGKAKAAVADLCLKLS